MLPPEFLAKGNQPSQPREGWEANQDSLLRLGAGAGALFGSGFIPNSSGGRLFDNYLEAVRSVEAGFPAAILRTFRISEFLSPLESWKNVSVDKEILKGSGSYKDFLSSVFGQSKSYNLKRTGSIFGQVLDDSGQQLGYGLRIQAGTQKGTAVADYYARLAGIQLTENQSLNESLLRSHWKRIDPGLNFYDWLKTLEPELRRQDLIIGAKLKNKIQIGNLDFNLSSSMSHSFAKAETVSNLFRSKAASTAGRLNTLLTAPFDIPYVGDVLAKIPGVRSMSVKPGSNLQLLSRFAKKGIGAGLAYKGFEYLDYLRSEDSPWAPVFGGLAGGLIGNLIAKQPGQVFSKAGIITGAAIGLGTAISDRFDEGYFSGGLSLLTDAKIRRAEFSEDLGLTEALRRQEEITPGLTDFSTGLAFGGVGALLAGLGGYSSFLFEAAKNKDNYSSFSKSLDATRELRADRFLNEFWSSSSGQRISKLPFLGKLSKIKSPMALGFVGGMAAWGVAKAGLSILSGNPLAALPSSSLIGTTETPEELQEIYSGEKEVAVKKGRFWEFGRCLSQDTEIITEFGINKKAKDVKVKDGIMTSDGQISKVTNVWKKEHNGIIYEIFTALDKNVSTSITENHKLPVLKKEKKNVYSQKEIEVKDLSIGDYVQVPIPKLKENINNLSLEDSIKIGSYLLDKEKIHPAQKNWYSKKMQRARESSLPRTIELTTKLGRLFGYFLAEGNLSYQKDIPYMIEIVHAKNEKWIVEDILSIVEKEFNITPTVRFKKGKKSTDEGCWIVRICSPLLARVFFELFYQSNRTQDKLFPLSFLSASKDFKLQLVEGYWRGDGHSEKKTRILSSCRKDFLDKTQLILLSAGYYPTIGNYESNDYRGRYRIRWNEDKAYKGRSRCFFKWVENKLFVKVQEIQKKEYSGVVYDFEVDHPEHLFQAGTFLVHNSSLWEGGKTEYFRQHALPRLKARAYEKGIYGSEQEKWDYDPLLHPIDFLLNKDNFRYHYEEKYQYERPGTVTAPLGKDIPFLGSLVSATFGKLLKPRKLIRPDEWIDEEGNFIHRPDPRGEQEPAYEYGGLGAGEPVSPDNLKQLFNDLNYRRREAVGLIGFMEGSITKSLIGREEFFENKRTFSEMGAETGSEYWLWKHLNLGGAAGTSEPIRRFMPRTRSYLETYNPLRNKLPSWIPEDYFLDLKHGNPFQKIPEAEIRLPGPGLAALNPELEGVAAEDYSLPWRVKVLGDIAMWSREYKSSLQAAKQNLYNYSDREQDIILATEQQVREKKKKKEFYNYRFNEDLLKESNVTIKKALSHNRFLTEEYGDMVLEAPGVGKLKDSSLAKQLAQELEGQKISIFKPSMDERSYDLISSGGRMKAVPFVDGQDYGSYLSQQGATEEKALKGEFEQLRFSKNERFAGQLSETLLHGIESPIESLTPISPAAKFIRHRSPIEEYKKSEAIGTSNAFWDKPLENFLKPTWNLTKDRLGLGEVSEEVQENRQIEEYFDMLKWVKYSRLESKARNEDNLDLAVGFKKEKDSTVFGTDVFKNPSDILTSLPRRDRDYFHEFANLKTNEEREEVLSLIPENEKRIYLSLWARKAEQAARAKEKANIATEEDQETLDFVSNLRVGEGFSFSKQEYKQWEEETDGQIPFDEWNREKKAEEYFTTHSLPDPSWISWSPSVDLEDVKLQFVEMLGKDHFDFDIWQNRKKGLSRKPYINTELVEEMLEPTKYLESWKVARNSKSLTEMYGSYDSRISQSRIDADLGPNRYNIEIKDGRKQLIEDTYKQMGM